MNRGEPKSERAGDHSRDCWANQTLELSGDYTRTLLFNCVLGRSWGLGIHSQQCSDSGVVSRQRSAAIIATHLTLWAVLQAAPPQSSVHGNPLRLNFRHSFTLECTVSRRFRVVLTNPSLRYLCNLIFSAEYQAILGRCAPPAVMDFGKSTIFAPGVLMLLLD